MKEKSAVPSILDDISIDSEFEVSVIAIPELPKMLTTRVSMDHFVDDNTITEMSGM